MDQAQQIQTSMPASTLRRPLGLGTMLATITSLVLSALSLSAWAVPPTLDQRLPNGMRVVVYEDHRAPTALHMVWIQAGSMDEVNGRTGLAHVLEHMMFKGTKTLGPGEFSQRVAALGGRENAFTSKEYTAYFQQVHRDALEQVMQLEADRMQNLRFSDEEFGKEIQVIREERRLRTEDSAAGRSYEALYATAFQANPVRQPIIGWMSDLQTMTAQDARDWYASHYSPANATMIVAGDVDAQAVLRKAEALYRHWAPKPRPETREQTEPPQLGNRRTEVSAPAENPMVMLAWQVPSLGPKDPEIEIQQPKPREVAALAVLSSVLTHPDFGRLSQKLVRQQRRALDVSASSDAQSRGPSLFVLQASPAPGVGVDALSKALMDGLQEVASKGVQPEELRLIRRLVKASEVYALDSLFARAMEAGQLITAGRPLSDAERDQQVLDDLRPEEVQAAARQLLDKPHTRIDLRPLPMAAAAPRGFSGLRPGMTP